MPFIWDDYEWKILEDDEEYDKDRFVIVRKLFVRRKSSSEVSLENHQIIINVKIEHWLLIAIGST